jgi:hypothetical protein
MERKPISQLGDELARLGPPTATYRPSLSSLLTRFAIAGLGFLFVGHASAIELRRNVDQNVDKGVSITFFLVMALILVFSIYFVWATVRQAYIRVMVFAEGLIRVGRADFVVARWKEIATIWHAKNVLHDVTPLATAQEVTIQAPDGERLTFTSDLKNVSELVQTIQKEVTPHLLGHAEATLASNGIIPFGRISVSRDGLKYGHSLLGWDQLDRIEIHKVFITIRKKGKWRGWLKMQTRAFPNLIVFLRLVDNTTGAKKTCWK